MKSFSSALGAVVLAAALVTSAQDAGAGVTAAVLDAGAADNWVHTNGNYAGQRYSTLTQVNTSNAKNLRIAWIYSLGGRTDAMATASYYDGVIFVPQDNKVFAMAGATDQYRACAEKAGAVSILSGNSVASTFKKYPHFVISDTSKLASSIPTETQR